MTEKTLGLMLCYFVVAQEGLEYYMKKIRCH